MNKNQKKYYSASEINKYTYCNYAWYYQKKNFKVTYDKKRKNSETMENFKRGIKFHNNYYQRNKKSSLMRDCFFVLALIIIIIVCSKLYGGNFYGLFRTYFG